MAVQPCMEWIRIKKKKKKKSVPATADNYNKHMGGIDKSDPILYVYLDERKSS